MSITHLVAPVSVPAEDFESGPTPPPVEGRPVPRLATHSAYEATDGSVSTGIWEATPGTFARAVVNAEFSHFIAGSATFVTEDGRRFEFKAGDAVYFPAHSRGVWTIHETLRKTYCIWK